MPFSVAEWPHMKVKWTHQVWLLFGVEVKYIRLFQLWQWHKENYTQASFLNSCWYMEKSECSWCLPCRHRWVQRSAGPSVQEWTVYQCAWFLPVPLLWGIWEHSRWEELCWWVSELIRIKIRKVFIDSDALYSLSGTRFLIPTWSHFPQI